MDLKLKIEELLNSMNGFKKIQVKYTDDKDGGHFITWEYMAKPKSGKTELEYFKAYYDEIKIADKLLYDFAEYCNKKKITYSLKLCKTRSFEDTDFYPVLLHSTLMFDFPETEYYLTHVNDDLESAQKEFDHRKEVLKLN